ncbi:12275_t:CDS:2 [Dentiscutata heterogama]|uniref:12275_t:CDS:1 n=1 Tax=Dentiscutata heterogama TaxID=1316150 RepID=A0ACA9LBH4_9GLOM|nr:12275_t:CDS:2 [Dentiscutata heterogama]
MVVIKLSSVKENVDYKFNSPTSRLSGSPTLINKSVITTVVRRVVWYPVVPLVAQICNSFLETYAYVNRVVSYPLLLLCTIGMSIQGLLNALIFSQDIAVTRAFQAVKLHWWINNVNSYEYYYPHLSHNKSITDEISTLGKSIDFIKLKTLNRNKVDIIKGDDVINDDIIYDDIINGYTNISSAFFRKDDLKQDITLDNQNNDQDINLVPPEPVHLKDSSSLDLLSHCANPSTLSDPLIGSSNSNKMGQANNTRDINNTLFSHNFSTNLIYISNYTGGDDMGQAKVELVNSEHTIRISEEFTDGFSSDVDISPQEIGKCNMILKRL